MDFIYWHLMASHGQQCTIMYGLYLLTFFLAYDNMSVLIGEKDFICGRTVKLNGQNETFAHVLQLKDHYWRYACKYISIDVR